VPFTIAARTPCEVLSHCTSIRYGRARSSSPRCLQVVTVLRLTGSLDRNIMLRRMPETQPAEAPVLLLPEAPTALNYLARATGYFAVSALALLGGFLISSAPAAGGPDWVLLGVPLGASGAFALCYAICFHREGEETSEELRKRIPLENLLIGAAIVIWLLASWIVFDWYRHSMGTLPARGITLVFVIQGTLFVAYGIFLLRNYRQSDHPPIRHLLVGPALLIIAMNLYIGLALAPIRSSFSPLYPLLVLIAWLLSSEVLVRRFVITGIDQVRVNFCAVGAAAGVALVSRVGGQPTLFSTFGQHLALLLFSIAVSAYLAVFEAWQLTARLAKKEFSGRDKSERFADDQSSTTAKYYVASLSALVSATWLVLIFFGFTDAGFVFVALFVTHAMYSFWWWRRKIVRPTDLISGRWLARKVVMAGALLSCILLDSRLTGLREFPELPDAAPWPIATVSGVMCVFVMNKLVQNGKWKARNNDISGWAAAVAEPKNALRLLSLLSWIGVLVLWGFRLRLAGTLRAFQVNAGMLAFLTFTGVAFLVEILGSDS
jgi:hypothetical protein